MPASTVDEENVQSLFKRIVPMLDAINLERYLRPEEASSIADAKTGCNNLVEDSWKLAILLKQKKITNDEYRRIVDFYVDSIAKKSN